MTDREQDTYTVEVWIDASELGQLVSYTDPVLKMDNGRVRLGCEITFRKPGKRLYHYGASAPWQAMKVEP